MLPRRAEIDLTTNGSGAVTAYSPVISGRILSIHYEKTNFSDGVDFDITLERTGQVLLDKDNVNAAAVFVPRQPTQDNVAAASLYAAGGEPVEDFYYAADDRIKVVVASGGAATTGRIVVIYG